MTLEAVIISLADFDIKMIVACDYDNHVNFLPIPSFLILQSSVILFVVWKWTHYSFVLLIFVYFNVYVALLLWSVGSRECI